VTQTKVELFLFSFLSAVFFYFVSSCISRQPQLMHGTRGMQTQYGQLRAAVKREDAPKRVARVVIVG